MSGNTRWNRNLLPGGWHLDEVYAERVYEDIHNGVVKGLTEGEIALSVGVSARTVTRYKARLRQAQEKRAS